MKPSLALPARWVLRRLRGVYLIQIGQGGVYLPCQANRYSLAQADRFKTKGAPKSLFFFCDMKTTPLFKLNPAFLPPLTPGSLFQISTGHLSPSARFITPQVPQVTQISGMGWYYSPFIFYILRTLSCGRVGRRWEANAGVCFPGIARGSQVGHTGRRSGPVVCPSLSPPMRYSANTRQPKHHLAIIT